MPCGKVNNVTKIKRELKKQNLNFTVYVIAKKFKNNQHPILF
jgi:hypothetical protein